LPNAATTFQSDSLPDSTLAPATKTPLLPIGGISFIWIRKQSLETLSLRTIIKIYLPLVLPNSVNNSAINTLPMPPWTLVWVFGDPTRI
jgi:hypothetical protein